MPKKKGPRKAKRPRSKKKTEWSSADFVNSVWNTMQKQAEENKALKMLHARLEPEWNSVVGKINEMLKSSDRENVTEHIEQVCNYGAKAVRPLIDVLLKVTKRSR